MVCRRSEVHFGHICCVWMQICSWLSQSQHIGIRSNLFHSKVSSHCHFLILMSQIPKFKTERRLWITPPVIIQQVSRCTVDCEDSLYERNMSALVCLDTKHLNYAAQSVWRNLTGHFRLISKIWTYELLQCRKYRSQITEKTNTLKYFQYKALEK